MTPTGVDDPLGVTLPLVEPGVPLLEYEAVLCLGVVDSYRENLAPATTAVSNLVAATSRALESYVASLHDLSVDPCFSKWTKNAS